MSCHSCNPWESNGGQLGYPMEASRRKKGLEKTSRGTARTRFPQADSKGARQDNTPRAGAASTTAGSSRFAYEWR